MGVHPCGLDALHDACRRDIVPLCELWCKSHRCRVHVLNDLLQPSQFLRHIRQFHPGVLLARRGDVRAGHRWLRPIAQQRQLIHHPASNPPRMQRRHKHTMVERHRHMHRHHKHRAMQLLHRHERSTGHFRGRRRRDLRRHCDHTRRSDWRQRICACCFSFSFLCVLAKFAFRRKFARLANSCTACPAMSFRRAARMEVFTARALSALVSASDSLGFDYEVLFL